MEQDNGGITVNIRELLSFLVKNVYKQLSNKRVLLKIKLSGDGRKSSRNFPFLLLTITIFDEGKT